MQGELGVLEPEEHLKKRRVNGRCIVRAEALPLTIGSYQNFRTRKRFKDQEHNTAVISAKLLFLLDK